MFTKRIEKIKEHMRGLGIQAALLTNDDNKFYVSGFRSSHFYILLTEKQNYLITDFRYYEMAQQNGGPFEIVKVENPNGIFDFLKEHFADQVIGIEEGHITYSFYQRLSECVKPDNLTSLQETVEKVRLIKDEEECAKIAKAASIAELGLAHILKFIKPGVSEQETALELEFFLRTNGAQQLSFDSIIVSGENSSLPHGKPGGRRFQNGDMITMDFGCVWEGYCSDMTRTVALGHVDQERREVYELVKKAQHEASLAVKAGMACKDLDKIAREIITQAGYGEYFDHGLGHGVGLAIHEEPTLNRRSSQILEENMLVTIEPGVYLPGQFGVRIEDLAIVKNDGIINLCQSSKDLIIL